MLCIGDTGRFFEKVAIGPLVDHNKILNFVSLTEYVFSGVSMAISPFVVFSFDRVYDQLLTSTGSSISAIFK